jgi:L-rhamnose isomerase
MSRYIEAKEAYATIGVDADQSVELLKNIKISMHCWQGDDVGGFDNDGPLTGGIQTTGNYPGKARTPKELMADIDKTLSLVPGKHRLNLHANYAVFQDGKKYDRNKLEPEHFAAWTDFAKERGLGLDFNPTFFSHEKATGLTLASPDSDIRDFWVEHGKACLKITGFFAEELNGQALMNVWIPDGYKDTPADRMGPRERFKDSMDRILTQQYDKGKVFVSLESKVFGIGVESYTVGSSEFSLAYALSRGILPLFDNGHYHPAENVSDKLSAALLFFDKVALHVTRPVRWDSDHVVRFDDEIREIAKEIINAGPQRFFIGTDYFDASINRIAAWALGMRNLQKALLAALLTPVSEFKRLQDEGRLTELLVKQEELKTMPLGDVWNRFCEVCGVPADIGWYHEVEQYEKNVLSKRG